jgi:hypothetical protein
MSDLLNRIRLRILRDHWTYLYNTAEALQENRMLDGLEFIPEEKGEEEAVVESSRRIRVMRKAPLDNMLTSCDCV